MATPLIEPLLSTDDLIPSIFNNAMGVSRAVKNHGFPPGRLISPQCRRWTKTEVQAWLDSRPTINPGNVRKGHLRRQPQANEELAHA